MPETRVTDARQRCQELWDGSVPFVRAEHEAEENLKIAQAQLRKAQKTATAVRAAWVDFVLKHDHRNLCVFGEVKEAPDD